MCAKVGIIEELSTTETPHLHGEAGRLIRTLVVATRALRHGGNVPAHLCEQAMHYYLYVHSLTLREALEGKAPCENFTMRPRLSLPKFHFGKPVANFFDEKRS